MRFDRKNRFPLEARLQEEATEVEQRLPLETLEGFLWTKCFKPKKHYGRQHRVFWRRHLGTDPLCLYYANVWHSHVYCITCERQYLLKSKDDSRKNRSALRAGSATLTPHTGNLTDA